MFSYFTSIVRVSEVKRERLFSGCTPEADKAELTEREPHALITHLFIPIASRHRHYDSLQRHLISKTKSPTRKEGDFIRSVHRYGGGERTVGPGVACCPFVKMIIKPLWIALFPPNDALNG